MYTAAVLTPPARQLLQQKLEEKRNMSAFVFETKSGEILPHHMTINMGSFDSSLNDPDCLGKGVTLWVTRFRYNDKVCCAEVVSADIEGKPIRTMNDQKSGKHITMCLRPPGKPVDSNELFKDGASIIEIDELRLDAVIQECN